MGLEVASLNPPKNIRSPCTRPNPLQMRPGSDCFLGQTHEEALRAILQSQCGDTQRGIAMDVVRLIACVYCMLAMLEIKR